MSGDGYVGKLLELHKGCQVPFLGSRGKVGFLSRLCSRKGENLGFLSCGRTLGIPLELRRGPQGPTRVASGKSSLHSSCEGPLGIPLQSVQEHRALSRFGAGTSGFLSSSDMDIWVPMEFRQGSQALSRVETWNSASLSRCKRVVRLPVYWHRDLGLFLEVPRGCHTSLHVLSR